MKRYTILSILFLSLGGIISLQAQKSELRPFEEFTKIETYDYATLKPMLHTDSEKIHILNFWATWCAPCVKELPILQTYIKEHPNTELILVSLDFGSNVEEKLITFLNERKIRATAIILDNPDVNVRINDINVDWSGAIPYTIIFNNRSRVFHQGEFEDLEELHSLITQSFSKE